MLDAIFTIGLVGRENGGKFIGDERPAPGPGGKSEQRLEVLRFRSDLSRHKRLFLLLYLLLELLNVEEHNARAVVRLAVVLHESFIGYWGGERLFADKFQFAPQPVDLRSARIVKQESTQRFVLSAVKEDAALSVSWDDRLEEYGRRKQRTKLNSRLGPFRGDARMYNLRCQRVSWRSFGDRFGKVATATRGSD